MEDRKRRLSPTTSTIFILCLVYILSISTANAAIAEADTSSSLSTYIIQLNYPSISLRFTASLTTLSVTRTVRNVGPANSRYKSVIDPIVGLDSIVVSPRDLVFTKANQTASYRVDFARKATSATPYGQGAITWVSAQHSVRTPVSVEFQ
ncbi:hypothetical protein NL676_010249 [Syzygium grande]|nr:hypothetical protein NL676_010249 [Syzygium grande]